MGSHHRSTGAPDLHFSRVALGFPERQYPNRLCDAALERVMKTPLRLFLLMGLYFHPPLGSEAE